MITNYLAGSNDTTIPFSVVQAVREFFEEVSRTLRFLIELMKSSYLRNSGLLLLDVFDDASLHHPEDLLCTSIVLHHVLRLIRCLPPGPSGSALMA
jgi:hypothetical protein